MNSYLKLLTIYIFGWGAPFGLAMLLFAFGGKIFVILAIISFPLFFISPFIGSSIICKSCKSSISRSPEGAEALTNYTYIFKPLFSCCCENCKAKLW